MESIYYGKRKYGSFIISLLIHIIIILLTVLIYKEKDNIFSGFTESAPFRQPAPVTVTYQSPKTNTNVNTRNKILQQTAATVPSSKPKEKKEEQKAKPIMDTKALEALKVLAAAKAKSIPTPVEDDGIEEIPEPEPVAAAPQSTRPKMTGAELLKAFLSVGKHSTSSDSRAGNQAYYGSSERSNGDGDTDYGYVNQRLNEFRYASYNTKIDQVLESAFNSRYHSIYFEEDIISSVILSITIQKDGKVKEAKLEKATGYAPLDDYILSVIKHVSFAPIPAHFNTELYQFRHQAGVTMQKGKAGTIVYRRSA